MNEEQFEDLLPFYVLGSLSAEEQRDVESYLDANPDGRLRLEEYARTVEALPLAVQPVPPSARTKLELMRWIEADAEASARDRQSPPPVASKPVHTQPEPRPRPRSFAFPSLAFGIAGLLLAAVATLWAFSLQAEISRLETANQALQSQMQTQQALLVQIASPNTSSASLSGTEAQPGASGLFIADPGRPDGVLVLSGLPPLEAGQTYQLWMIEGDLPASAGLFNTDSQGQILLPVQAGQAVGSYDALGVSVEPQGGSGQPTGEIVVLSPLSF
jgi:anti-sigma-K factor RskA